MKKLLLLTIIAYLGILAGCQNDIDGTSVGATESTTNLRVGIKESNRTQLGEKGDDGIYPLYWSEGDCIAVNGEHSHEAQIDATNRSIANFTFDNEVSYPLNITYPVHTQTSLSKPVVTFPAAQSYAEGTFSLASAPMCGYVANKSEERVLLQHLSGLLRFPVKTKSEGVALSKVVITAENKIAGDFDVKCKDAILSARSSASNEVVYTLPSNFTLSTTEEQVLYIALPKGNVGECTIVFYDNNGGKMLCNWNNKTVLAGTIHKFQPLTYDCDKVYDLSAFEVKSDIILTPDFVYGYVTDSDNNPIEGVAVSDGFTITQTDSDGLYIIYPSNDAWHIYITVPAEYEIPIKNDQPGFYHKYNAKNQRYDFKLKPLANGKEEKFALFVIGDPQVGSQNGINRLRTEATSAIKTHAATWQSQGIPCYGITLGDLISNNNSSDRSGYRQSVFDAFAVSKTGMPVFHVMGNHDNTYFNAANPLSVDERSSSTELKAQRAHEEVCGPVNFSFDRGDMHIISMRNIVYNSAEHCENSMRRAFIREHYQWLKQDLALVPKDKTVILCVHIPFQDGGGSYIDYTRALINDYKEAHIMSGHSHLIQHLDGVDDYGPKIYEHNMGALCGAWWTSYMCGDGTPAGYGVFLAEGTTFTDWYHIGYSKTAQNRSHQMRLYRGDAVTGANKASGDTGLYAFNFDKDVLLANVYMADSKWTIKVYEDGEYSGEMTNISVANGQLANVEHFRRPKIYRDEGTTPSADGAGYGYMLGDGTDSNPYKSSVVTSGDIYFSGLTNGKLAFNDWAFGTNAQCYHMYMYKLKKGSFDNIKVVAIDKFGNEYTETKITEGTDYSTVAY